MKRILFFLLFLTAIDLQEAASQPLQVSGTRIYKMAYQEMPPSVRSGFDQRFNAQIDSMEASRGAVLSALFAANRSQFVTKVASTTEDMLGVTISRLTESFKSPRGKWERAVNNECFFTQKIWMTEEVKDFYSNCSTKGALDPFGIVFDGFTCREDIQIKLKDKDTLVNVFYVSCKLDTCRTKIKRMLTHSKFEVYIDSVRFDPFNCDLPNDSLQDLTKRIRFSFENRDDLRLKIHADVTSSWINEAIMIFKNQKLGEFDINIKINPNVVINHVDNNGRRDSVYTYSRRIQGALPPEEMQVTGESFIVPRSYSGNNHEGESIWGTGQYKIDMQITETCRIKRSYYVQNEDGMGNGHQPVSNNGKRKKEEWKKGSWEPEWELISSRPAEKTFWSELGAVIKTNWTGSEWLTELISPTTSYFLKEGSTILNGGVVLDKYNMQGMTGSTTGAQGSGPGGQMPSTEGGPQ